MLSIHQKGIKRENVDTAMDPVAEKERDIKTLPETLHTEQHFDLCQQRCQDTSLLWEYCSCSLASSRIAATPTNTSNQLCIWGWACCLASEGNEIFSPSQRKQKTQHDSIAETHLGFPLITQHTAGLDLGSQECPCAMQQHRNWVCKGRQDDVLANNTKELHLLLIISSLAFCRCKWWRWKGVSVLKLFRFSHSGYKYRAWKLRIYPAYVKHLPRTSERE